jgi:hypothetical protein
MVCIRAKKKGGKQISLHDLFPIFPLQQTLLLSRLNGCASGVSFDQFLFQ